MTITWNSSPWAQQRNIMRVSGLNASAVTIEIVTSSPSGYSARYVPNNNRTLDADLTDLVRVSNTGAGTVSELDTNGGVLSSVSFSWNVRGLINPQADIVPNFCEVLSPSDPEFVANLIVIPPSLILRGSVLSLMCELRATTETEFDAGFYASGVWNSNLILDAYGHKTCVAPASAQNEIIIRNVTEDVIVATIPITETNPEKEYATIEWTSRYGTRKIATFERRNVKYAAKDTISLADLSNEYDVRKGQEIGFTAFLENLSAYDYWYYSDIITSSYVAINNKKVEVTTKDVTIPNSSAGEFKKLEIQINYAKYDTL